MAHHSGRLNQTIGLTVPILQSGMGGVAGPDLVAAVSNAGGLGTLAALRLTPDQLRNGIRRVRELTDKPFGVNIWLHKDVRQSPDPASLSDDLVHRAQDVLNELRPRFDLEPTLAPPGSAPDLVDDALEVMLDERIPVFSAAIGVPEPSLVERFHRSDTQVVAMVADVAGAQEAAASDCDVIVAQGSEAGGHRSYGEKLPSEHARGVPTLQLVPDVIAVLDGALPVVAAGGIVNGRGLANALAAGADGVLMGTRFVATTESEASDLWKQRIVDDQNESVVTDGFTGQWARVLRSEFTDLWQASDAVALPGLLQATLGADLFGAAKQNNDDQVQPLYVGEAVDLIDDLPGAAEVVERIMREAATL